jgi:hypothetical protein
LADIKDALMSFARLPVNAAVGIAGAIGGAFKVSRSAATRIRATKLWGFNETAFLSQGPTPVQPHYQPEGSGIGLNASISAYESFFSKVAGVSHCNDDGSSRQDTVKKCHPGERLVWHFEPGNRFDPNAIGLFRLNGAQLGHVTARVAETISKRHSEGYKYAFYVKQLTGDDTRCRGLNLLVIEGYPGSTEQQMDGFFESAWDQMEDDDFEI